MKTVVKGFHFLRGIKIKITHKMAFLQLQLFLLSTVLPAKTQGPSQTLHQGEGRPCPLGSSQSCCCPMVLPPNSREEGVNVGTAAGGRRMLRNTHSWCVRGIYGPLTEAFPVESLKPPGR